MGRYYLLIVAALSTGIMCHAQLPAPRQSKSGLRLVIAEEDRAPAVSIVLPGRPDADRSIYILFPEHVTVRAFGNRRKAPLSVSSRAGWGSTRLAQPWHIAAIRARFRRRDSHARQRYAGR